MNSYHIKQKLIEAFLNYCKKNENIESVFIVGTMCSNDYQLQTINDFDIRIISKIITQELLKSVENVFDCIRLENKSKNIDFQFSTDIGPAKPIEHNEVNVLIHCLVFTKEDLDQLPKIHKKSYSEQYEVVYGKDLIAQYKSIILDYNDILFADEGINYCVNLIVKKQHRYKKYVFEEGAMIIKSFVSEATDNEYSEILSYSLKKSLENLYRLCLQRTNYNYSFYKFLKKTLCLNDDEISCINSIYHDDVCPLKFADDILQILETEKEYIINKM